MYIYSVYIYIYMYNICTYIYIYMYTRIVAACCCGTVSFPLVSWQIIYDFERKLQKRSPYENMFQHVVDLQLTDCQYIGRTRTPSLQWQI